MKKLYFIFFLLFHLGANAQYYKDQTFVDYVRGIQFCVSGNQKSYPVMQLGGFSSLLLQFDDLEATPKRYNYSFQLCDVDWNPVNMNSMDYIQGFIKNPISSFQNSSIAKVNYNHYSISFPQQQSYPTKSGNYILHVFLNGDTSQKIFDRRFLVVDNHVDISGEVMRLFDANRLLTDQKVQFSLNVRDIQVLDPNNQVKVSVLQNFRWDNAKHNLKPAFINGNTYQYNGERDVSFHAGKEYRWLNLQSFRYYSDRVKYIDKNSIPKFVEVIPDLQRSKTKYLPYQDYNGYFYFNAYDDINVSYNGDFGKVKFSFQTYDSSEWTDKNIYIVGQFNNYICDENSKLYYNKEDHIYENNQLLKQGYYSYIYVTKPIDGSSDELDNSQTEGNFWQTENDYTILVYYRDFNNRYDQLIGLNTINSRDFIGGN